MPDIGSGLVYYVVFLFSTTLHEAAHAWAAIRGGDPTAYHGGQVSLDPRAHIRREPFGMVGLPLISVVLSGWPFGFASAPCDPRWAMRYPKRAAWIGILVAWQVFDVVFQPLWLFAVNLVDPASPTARADRREQA